MLELVGGHQRALSLKEPKHSLPQPVAHVLLLSLVRPLRLLDASELDCKLIAATDVVTALQKLGQLGHLLSKLAHWSLASGERDRLH